MKRIVKSYYEFINEKSYMNVIDYQKIALDLIDNDGMKEEQDLINYDNWKSMIPLILGAVYDTYMHFKTPELFEIIVDNFNEYNLKIPKLKSIKNKSIFLIDNFKIKHDEDIYSYLYHTYLNSKKYGRIFRGYFNDNLVEYLSKIKDDLDRIISENKMYIYRLLGVDDSGLKRIIKGDVRLGIYWTYKNSINIFNKFNHNDENYNLVLKSNIDSRFINYYDTLKLSVIYDKTECEIRLFKNTPVTISDISQIVNDKMITNRKYKIDDNISIEELINKVSSNIYRA